MKTICVLLLAVMLTACSGNFPLPLPQNAQIESEEHGDSGTWVDITEPEYEDVVRYFRRSLEVAGWTIRDIPENPDLIVWFRGTDALSVERHPDGLITVFYTEVMP